MTDDLIVQAQQHIAHDHQRDEALDHAQRFAEALEADTDAARRQVGAELIEIVGRPA